MSLPASEPWHRNLLHTFDELVDHLGDVVTRLDAPRPWPRALVWDAFLTVCATSQVLDDFIHRGFSGLAGTLGAVRVQPGKVGMLPFLPARLATGLPRLVRSRVLGAVAMGIDAIVGARVQARARWRERDLLELATEVHEVACASARPLVDGAGGSAPADTALVARLVTLHEAFERRRRLHPLGERVLKIPACFKDFDCHPDDCAELARRFVARGGARTAPVTVVGIRTSGSYLGPLCVAALREQGYTDVRLASMRQKVPVLATDRTLLRTRGRAGTVLVVDDPPVSGSTLCQVTDAIVRLGVPAGHIASLVPADPDAPFFRSSRAKRIDVICLPRSEWRIARVLEAIGPPADLDPAGTSPRRSHAQARAARTANAAAGTSLLAKGIGVGWYAAHAQEAGSSLGEFVAPGMPGDEGVFLEQWVEGPSLADRPDACDERVLRHVGSYVAARARRLAIRTGRAGDIEDRATGWQTLAATFARSYALLAPLAYGHLRRRLATIGAAAPRAAIDGRMGPQKWIVPVGGAMPVKVDFEEHAFDRTDTAVLDPVLDLAAFSLDQGLSLGREAALVATYVQGSGDRNAASRLACCKLIAGLGRRHHLERLLAGGASGVPGARDVSSVRAAAIERTRLDRRLSSTANRFLAAVLDVGGLAQSPRTRLVAIDIDGVLEDGLLGFTATSPAGVLALRTLKRHAYEPILASGRSLEEVVERARTFGLRAAIAEYGAAVWIDGVPFGLALDEERAQLAALRALLATETGVIVDDAYTHSVRVFRHDGVARRAVSAAWLDGLLARERLGALRTIVGEDQVDVVGASCTKGRALLVLRERLGAREVHAVGDTAEDIAMLREAHHAWTPANGRRATAGMDRPVRVARARRAKGLLEIAQIIAHGRPRACALCTPPTLAPHDRSLADAFAIRDRGRAARMLDLLGPEALDPLWISR